MITKFTLKQATLIAAIGTTIYVFFSPICRLLLGEDTLWFNYQEHPWCSNAWYILFSGILMVSWATLALGIIRDGKHFPIFSKRVRYTLLIITILLLLMIFLPRLLFPMNYLSYPRRFIHMPAWVCILHYIVWITLLWYIYVHIFPSNHSYQPRWQKGICWAMVILTLLVVVKQITAIIGYAFGLLTGKRLGIIHIFREVHYNADWICNWLTYYIPITFYLLIFMQPIISSLTQRKSQKLPPTSQNQTHFY